MRNSPFFPSVVLIGLLTGCIGLHQGGASGNAEALKQEGKSGESAEFYEQVANDHPGTERGAEALFTAARLRCAPDNPQKDYQRAFQDFDEFLRGYPNNPRAGEARAWRSLLKTILELKKENERLAKSIEELKRVDIRQEELRRK